MRGRVCTTKCCGPCATDPSRVHLLTYIFAVRFVANLSRSSSRMGRLNLNWRTMSEVRDDR